MTGSSQSRFALLGGSTCVAACGNMLEKWLARQTEEQDERESHTIQRSQRAPGLVTRMHKIMLGSVQLLASTWPMLGPETISKQTEENVSVSCCCRTTASEEPQDGVLMVLTTRCKTVPSREGDEVQPPAAIWPGGGCTGSARENRHARWERIPYHLQTR